MSSPPVMYFFCFFLPLYLYIHIAMITISISPHADPNIIAKSRSYPTDGSFEAACSAVGVVTAFVAVSDFVLFSSDSLKALSVEATTV